MQGQDLIKNQLLTMGMMSKDGNNSMFTIIWGIILMNIIEAIVKAIPVVYGHFIAFATKKFEKKKEEYTQLIQSDNPIKSSIIFEKTKSSNEIANSLIEYMSRQDSAIVLKFIDDFYVNSKVPFKINYSDLECKFLETKYDDKGSIELIIFEIYSRKLTLLELREWVDSIHRKHILASKNKLGNKKYYFNEFPVIPPKNQDQTYRFETSPKKLTFIMTEFNTNKNLENMFGPDIVQIKKRIELFNNQEWYKKRGIPHTLGILLSGLPGTGKTSSIKAIASITGRHIFNISLRDFTTQNQLFNLFYDESVTVLAEGQSKTYYIPIEQRLFVIEDIDCLTDVVIDRRLRQVPEKSGSDQVNLSFLLNLLDGVLEIPNRLLIITSNYPEKLDPALIRPGRIDLIVKFDTCTVKTIKTMFETFYEMSIEFPMNDYYKTSLSPAEVTRIMCVNYDNYQLALNEIIGIINENKEVDEEIVLEKVIKLPHILEEVEESTHIVEKDTNKDIKKDIEKESQLTVEELKERKEFYDRVLKNGYKSLSLDEIARVKFLNKKGNFQTLYETEDDQNLRTLSDLNKLTNKLTQKEQNERDKLVIKNKSSIQLTSDETSRLIELTQKGQYFNNFETKAENDFAAEAAKMYKLNTEQIEKNNDLTLSKSLTDEIECKVFKEQNQRIVHDNNLAKKKGKGETVDFTLMKSKELYMKANEETPKIDLSKGFSYSVDYKTSDKFYLNGENLEGPPGRSLGKYEKESEDKLRSPKQEPEPHNSNSEFEMVS